MEASKALLDTLMMTTEEAILVIDPERRIVKASKAFEATTGLRLPARHDSVPERLEHVDGFAALSSLVGAVCASGECRRGARAEQPHRRECHIAPVQGNGKLRSRIRVGGDVAEDEIRRLAQADEKVAQHLNGRQIVKIIVVPQKLINIVVK